MTPRQFEAQYAPAWAELEQALAALDASRGGRKARRRRAALGLPGEAAGADAPPRAARIAQLYRQCCEHLALARERAYPVHLVARLEALTERAHQRIYRRHDFGLGALRELILREIPAGVRALRWQVLVALAVTALPALGVGLATWFDPHFALVVMSPAEARGFDQMYGPEAAEHLGRTRTSGTDAMMFGYYVMHNVGLSFQCFASGVALGVGSLVMLAYNGLLLGVLAGYLGARGDGERFFSFVCTHAAFELTAIVLSGAAGLRLGQALLAPGRRTRGEALRRASLETAPVLYCVFMFLLVAAAIEAFWSSAGWIAPPVKYAVATACWVLVIAYLCLQGRARGEAAR